MASDDSITIRRADPGDLPAIIEVCGRALDWSDPVVDEGFFRWKHLDNPFGPSPIWVAEAVDEGSRGREATIVGVRAMMRWRLRAADGRELRMVRAVDTATLPSHQGRGIFSRLTRGAVEALAGDGEDAVFNTPNDASRPGYLKMGWVELGRLPVRVRPRTLGAVATMVRSRVAADKWGLPTEVGLDPAEALADPEPIEAAIASDPARAGLSTPLTVDYLRWRTGFAPLAARIEPLLPGHGPERGFVVFRLRHRGDLRQLSLLHIVGASDGATRRRAVGRLLAETGGDVALAAGPSTGLGEWLLPLPGAGPIMTWRVLADPGVPARSDLDLELGAVELF